MEEEGGQHEPKARDSEECGCRSFHHRHPEERDDRKLRWAQLIVAATAAATPLIVHFIR